MWLLLAVNFKSTLLASSHRRYAVTVTPVTPPGPRWHFRHRRNSDGGGLLSPPMNYASMSMDSTPVDDSASFHDMETRLIIHFYSGSHPSKHSCLLASMVLSILQCRYRFSLSRCSSTFSKLYAWYWVPFVWICSSQRHLYSASFTLKR